MINILDPTVSTLGFEISAERKDCFFIAVWDNVGIISYGVA